MRSTLLAVLVLVGLNSIAAAQAPDFTGTWSLPPDAPAGPSGKPTPAPGFGSQISITQDARSITISKVISGQTVHVVHPLDGSESRTRTPGRLCEGDGQTIWTATRTADAIETVLVGVLPAGASAPTKSGVKTTFRLTAPDTMVVELAFP